MAAGLMSAQYLVNGNNKKPGTFPAYSFQLFTNNFCTDLP